MNWKSLGFAVVMTAMPIVGLAAPSHAQSNQNTWTPTERFCFYRSGPVCATKAGLKQNYANACFAVKDGAHILAEGRCKPAKARKRQIVKNT